MLVLVPFEVDLRQYAGLSLETNENENQLCRDTAFIITIMCIQQW